MKAVFLVLCVSLSLTWAKSFPDFLKRVINGEQANPKDYPWVAFIEGEDPDEPCSGSILSDEWVLTAASCVHEASPKKLTVTLGITDKTKQPSNRLGVKKIIAHENYNDDTLDSDLALLQLSTKASMSDVVQAINLPKQGDKVAVGTMCNIVGWGTTKSDTLTWPQYLQKAELPIVGNKDCKALFSANMMNVCEKTMLCAGGNGKSGCQGDNGGPLVCKEGGQWVLRGIGSWGDDNCDPSKYIVTTRVSTFVDWIKNKIE